MPGQLLQNGAVEELKHKKKRKRKSRTVDLSSDSESDEKGKKSRDQTKASIKELTEQALLQKTVKPPSTSPEPANDRSTGSTGLYQAEPAPVRPNEDFTSIYLRKITAELGDDLVKLRDASDFTDRSIPLLRHALTQGISIFSDDEKRRVMSGVNQ